MKLFLLLNFAGWVMGYASWGRLRAVTARRRKKYLQRTIVIVLVITIGIALIPTLYNFRLPCLSYVTQNECLTSKKARLFGDFTGNFVAVAGCAFSFCLGFWLAYGLRTRFERKIPKSDIGEKRAAQLSELPPFDDNDYQELVGRYRALDDQSLRDLSMRKESLRIEAVRALEGELERRGMLIRAEG
jgi:hypothetical protein